MAGIVIRLAIFNRFFFRQAGGAESYSVALAESFADKRCCDGSPEFEVHVFAQTIRHHHPLITYHKVPGPLRRPRWINQLFFAGYTWWKTQTAGKDKRFDVIHSHENTWHGAVQTVHVRPLRYNLFFPDHKALTGWRLAARWLKVCTSPRLGFYIGLEAARMRKACVVAVSEETKRQTLLAYPRLNAADVPVILPGVSTPNLTLNHTEARAKLGLPQDKKVILFVGNDYARKGLPALLAAMPALQANIHLLCVGAAPEIPRFQLLAANLGVTERVHFVGSLADISVAYRAADLLVHPTLEDAFAMVVLEAMSYGLPVVVSSAKYCGITTFLKEGVDALVLNDPFDKVAIGNSVMRIFNDDSLRQNLKVAGLGFAAQHHWDKATAQYAALYKKAVDPAN